jgi:hypothetical protein
MLLLGAECILIMITVLPMPIRSVDAPYIGKVVPMYGARSEFLASTPGATKFSEEWFWNGVHSA